MKDTAKFLQEFARERPVGTKCNADLIDLLEKHLEEMGYTIAALPFDCTVWTWNPSELTVAKQAFPVEPSPFSEPFAGNRPVIHASTVEALRNADCRDAILLLSGEIAQTPLSPKDYPFYYPDAHKDLIALLEQKKPGAILAVTGATPLNGKNPFPLFEDGNFLIPSANIDTDTFLRMQPHIAAGAAVHLAIASRKDPGRSRQLVASKKVAHPKGKIVLAAHMDSKYDTPGALDNAAGVAVLLEVAGTLHATGYDVDIVPFNSEEYYGASGELLYLEQTSGEQIALMINIDSPCHIGSQTAVSFYNLSEEALAAACNAMERHPLITKGDAWYAGDHAPFLFRGIPCMAVTSSDFFEGALACTHTPGDTLQTVDEALVKVSAAYLVDAIAALS